MPESQAPIKKKQVTSKGKSKISKKATQTTMSSKMSDQGSTSSDQACKPFWNKSTAALSAKLWSGTKTDSVDTDWRYWNSSSKRLGQNSWFSVTNKRKQAQKSLQMTSLPSQQYLLQGIMDSVPPKTEESGRPMVARKVRVYPTSQQKQVLNSWFGCARWTYNNVVQHIKSREVKASKGALRKACINKEAIKDKGWLLETPYDIRDEAMADVLKAIQSNLAAKRERFNLKFRSRKDEHQSISVLKKHWNHTRGVYSHVLNSTNLKSPEKLPDALECDSRLIRTRLGHYYLCLPMELKVSSAENQGTAGAMQTSCVDGIISLDPGIRTFMTGYDASGQSWEWGKQDIERIYRLCHTADSLQARWSDKAITHKRRYSLQKAARRVRLKIRNLIDDVHKKLSKWLCENYKVVLLPKFETSRMVRRGQRKLNSKSARAMATWAHYRFRQRLLQKSHIYSGMSVIVCDEAYTSKTCGLCGELNTKLGGNKLFQCSYCGAQFDRDVNGARNILLRYMTLQCHETCTSV